MIIFNGVTKTFGKTIALDNVSFNITPGKTTALLGANGCGKTTILRLIASILSPTNGSISVDGLDSVKNSDKVRKCLGFMLGGDTSLINQLTARENIMYFARMQGLSKKQSEENICKLCQDLNMNEFIDRRVVGFSRGQRQKVVFAESLIHNPKILLLDEPSTGLDINAIEDVLAFVQYNKSQNKTIILSSHNMHEVQHLADEILLLDKGKILFHGSVSEFTNNGKVTIEKAFQTITKGGKYRVRIHKRSVKGT